MRIRFATSIAMLLCLLGLPADAGAQSQVPDQGMAAIGGEVGIFLPQEIFETSLTAAVGAYWLQYKFSGRSTGVSAAKLGVRVGGGIEYFPRRTVTIKGEGLYHFVQQGDLPWSPSGLTLTIGIKRYF